MTTRPEPLLPPPGGEWTRDCWKCLDKCLVAERLAIAAADGLGTDLFADTGDVSKDAVLDRFANQLGGASVLAILGPDWSRCVQVSRGVVTHAHMPPQGQLDPEIRRSHQEAVAPRTGVCASRRARRDRTALPWTLARSQGALGDDGTVPDGRVHVVGGHPRRRPTRHAQDAAVARSVVVSRTRLADELHARSDSDAVPNARSEGPTPKGSSVPPPRVV
jgi:hypothetical protein